MSTANTPATDTKAEKKNDIYVGYAGKFDAASFEEKKTKADKPMATAVLVVAEGKKVHVSTFSADGIAALKDAANSGAEQIVQGYLSDAPGYMNLHKFGATSYEGELRNPQSGVSEGGVAWFDAILMAKINDKTIPLKVKAFGDAATALSGANDRATVALDGYAARMKEGQGEDAGYRSGVQVTQLTKLELATEAKAEAKVEDNAPAM
jgi:hypothetical protein